MKVIRFKGSWGASNQGFLSIEQAVRHMVAPIPYGSDGQLEKEIERLNNTVELIGRLVDGLVSKGLLSHEEVALILGLSYEVVEE